MGAIIRSKAPLMIPVQTSGSRVSAAAVEPFTSQNNMVITRRSPASALPDRADFNLAISSCGRYWSRNPALAPLLLTPARRDPDKSAPQFMQNFALSGLTVFQLGQFIRS